MAMETVWTPGAASSEHGVEQAVSRLPSRVAVAPAGLVMTVTSAGSGGNASVLFRAGGSGGGWAFFCVANTGDASGGLAGSSAGFVSSAVAGALVSGLGLFCAADSAGDGGAGGCGVVGLVLASTAACDAAGVGEPAAALPFRPPGVSHDGADCHPISASTAAATRIAARNGRKPVFDRSPRALADIASPRRGLRAGGNFTAPRGPSASVGSFKAPPRANGFQVREATHAFSSARTKS